MNYIFLEQNMTEEVTIKSARIFENMQQRLNAYFADQERFKSKIDKLYTSFKEGNFSDVTLDTLEKGIKNVNKLRKQRTDIYLINYAKVNLDNEATEVIGNYDTWKKHKAEVEKIQKGILDLIHIDGLILKTLNDCKFLLNNVEKPEVQQ